jgi:uncharacterized protein (DUF1499 family)
VKLFSFVPPVINDITTDPNRPPKILPLDKSLRQQSLQYPSDFWSQQRAYYPQIKPVAIKPELELEEFWSKLLSFIKERERWQIRSIDNEIKRVQLVATTPLLRFKDDMVIELRLVGDRRLLHMRSRSRVGRSDFGANAARMEGLMNYLESQSLGESVAYEDSSH